MEFDIKDYNYNELSVFLDSIERRIYTCVNSPIFKTLAIEHMHVCDFSRAQLPIVLNWLKSQEEKFEILLNYYNLQNKEADILLKEIQNKFKIDSKNGLFMWGINCVDDCSGTGADEIDIILNIEERKIYTWSSDMIPLSVHNGKDIIIATVPSSIDIYTLKKWLIESEKELDELANAFNDSLIFGNDSDLKSLIYHFQNDLREAILYGGILEVETYEENL